FLQLERDFFYAPQQGSEPIYKSRYVPNIGALAQFTNAYSTPLTTSQQGGRRVLLGASTYLDSGRNTWKALISDSENFRLFGLTTGTAKIAASHVSARSPFPDANVVVTGRPEKLVFLDFGLPTHSLEEMVIRGYPSQTFFVR